MPGSESARSERVQRLLSAQGLSLEESPFYDEALQVVIDRVADSGSLDKADIGALLFWKRLNASTEWVSKLHALPDAQVREVTRKAVCRRP